MKQVDGVSNVEVSKRVKKEMRPGTETIRDISRVSVTVIETINLYISDAIQRTFISKGTNFKLYIVYKGDSKFSRSGRAR